MTTLPRVVGPILFLDTVTDDQMHLAALFVTASGQTPGPITQGPHQITPVKLAEYDAHDVYRARFTLPAGTPSLYHWNGQSFDVAGLGGDLRIAHTSCNGEEHGDMDRDPVERNALWARLVAELETNPVSLLLQGGDQIYADEITHGHHLSENWPERIPRDPSRADLLTLATHLREGFLQRYLANYADPNIAHVMARVPSLMQWDDHDICDGWGSLRRSRTYSPVGQCLFTCAREAALLFQHGTVDGDLPDRFADPSGMHLGWSLLLPGLRIIAPDLRGERTRREILSARAWQWLEDLSRRPHKGRTLVMSSVPLLGPRLSLLELVMVLIPSMQKYEDDLRDQWQSRAHRDSWRHMLTLMRRMAAPSDQAVTVISGEIHLATRAEMKMGADRTLHQLVTAGMAHRPPPQPWARFLGALAGLGEAPLKHMPITIRPIPGQKHRYTAQRSTLFLYRQAGTWSARWQFETDGLSPPLPL